jgi:hypothetical protein
MLIQDSEVAGMICPQTIVGTVDAARPGAVGACQGARCMAWRPVSMHGKDAGYCGMAGAPALVLEYVQHKVMALAQESAEARAAQFMKDAQALVGGAHSANQ